MYIMFFQVFWFTGKSFFGYEDIGEGQGQKPATHVMMFMVTALNMRWKLPIAYFLLPHSFSGKKRADLLRPRNTNYQTDFDSRTRSYKGDCGRNPYCT